ncbi:MAG: tetratricopeptide repeat protein [Ekhidna sp.]
MRTLLTVIIALISVSTFAQKKPNINKAKAAMEKGELAEAKTIIDQAIEHEKTKDDAKTWYYRGMIYASLDTAMNEPEARAVAMSSFNKSLEIDPEQKSTSSFTGVGIENVDSKIQGYYSHFYNGAVVAYQGEDYLTAADNFEKAAFINPADTNAIMNAAFSATALGDNDRAQVNYNKAFEAGSRSKTIFLTLYNYAATEERYEDALTIIRDAKAAYPNSSEFSKYEINLLIQLDKVEEAKTEIETAIAQEPNNADLQFSLGVLKEELDDIEGATTAYLKAIELDPTHYNANFNLGVSYFNESNEMIKERNALGYKETKKYDELTLKINDQLKKAMPLWETLYSIKSDDRTVLETLSYIYTNLKMNDKAMNMQDEIDKL